MDRRETVERITSSLEERPALKEKRIAASEQSTI